MLVDHSMKPAIGYEKQVHVGFLLIKMKSQ